MSLRDLTEVKKAYEIGNDEQLKMAWNQIIDPKSIYKLLYCLRIIHN